MAPTHVNQRVQKHREAMRAAGLRPIQIWVPDTRKSGFADECRRQSKLIAEAEASDLETQAILDDALADVEGWEE